MYNIMSKPLSPHYSPSVELNTVWMVDADSTYAVSKPFAATKHFIAIRTYEGAGSLVLSGGVDLVLETGSLAVFRLDKVIRYCCTGTNWGFMWFEFNADLSILPRFDTVHNFLVTEYETKLMHDCFNTLNSVLPFSALKASCEFGKLLVFWASSLTPETNSYSIMLERAIDYLMHNTLGNTSVAQLAQIAGMSERSFRDNFIQYTNKTPKIYIEERRLNAAKELLKNTSMQVKEISLSLGYKNQYYFSRAFRKFFGTSPTMYRRS